MLKFIRKNWRQFVAVFVTLSLFCASVSASISDLKNQQEEIRQKATQARDLLNDTQTQKSDVMNEILTLDAELEKAEQEFEMINEELYKTSVLLEQTEKKLQEATISRENQYEALKARIQYMQEHGNINYFEILLSSASFGDFINRLEYIDAIIQYDSAIVDRLTETEQLIADAIEDITEKKIEIEVLLSLQESKNRLLEEAALAKNEAIYALTLDEDSFLQQVKDLEAEDAKIQTLIKEAEEEAAKAAKEKAEREAAEKKAAEEKKKAEAAKAAQTSFVSGKFINPLPGYAMTSKYGNRIHPISGKNEFHTGIDIGAPKGTSIIAAASGTVIFVGYKGGYGNTVIIDHGGGFTTLYAHNSKILVSEGSKVSTGQSISLCGSTGYSTGPHLHFEIRVNGVHKNPIGYIKI